MEKNFFTCKLKDGTYEHFDYECNEVAEFFNSKCIVFKKIDYAAKTFVTLAIIPIDSISIIKGYKKELQEDKQ